MTGLKAKDSGQHVAYGQGCSNTVCNKGLAAMRTARQASRQGKEEDKA